MDLDNLQVEISQTKQDIDGLQSEVLLLKDQYESLLLTYEQYKEDPVTNEDRAKDDQSSDFPPSVHFDSRFDSSIGKYFPDNESIPTEPTPKPISTVTSNYQLHQAIIYENLFRFAGVTSFPINNVPVDQMLGLRFDIFSSSSSCFLTPHYIILKKITVSNKQTQSIDQWCVFKHTLPSYIPYKDYEKQLHDTNDISKFATSIRKFLVSIQYKHDKLHQLQSLNWSWLVPDKNEKIISKIDLDLAADRVIIHLKSCQIELICSPFSIEIANFNTSNQAIDSCKSILTDCLFTDLLKNFRKVLTLLHENEMI